MDDPYQRIKDLEHCLADLIRWCNEPEVKSQDTLAWTHGFRISEERAKILHEPWKRAHELLGIEWTTK